MGPACVQTDAQLLAAHIDPRPSHPTLQGHEGEGQHPIPPATTDAGLYYPITIQFPSLLWSKETSQM